MQFVVLKNSTTCIGPFKTEEDAKTFINTDAANEKAEYEVRSDLIPAPYIDEEWCSFYGVTELTLTICDRFMVETRKTVWKVTELVEP